LPTVLATDSFDWGSGKSNLGIWGLWDFSYANFWEIVGK
jgi:hypothetical protein